MMKKSPVETAVVALLVKGVVLSKFDVLLPVAYLTILEIVAPASVLVKVVATPPIARAVVRVMAPAVSEPRVAFGVPRVAV